MRKRGRERERKNSAKKKERKHATLFVVSAVVVKLYVPLFPPFRGGGRRVRGAILIELNLPDGSMHTSRSSWLGKLVRVSSLLYRFSLLPSLSFSPSLSFAHRNYVSYSLSLSIFIDFASVRCVPLPSTNCSRDALSRGRGN